MNGALYANSIGAAANYRHGTLANPLMSVQTTRSPTAALKSSGCWISN